MLSIFPRKLPTIVIGETIKVIIPKYKIKIANGITTKFDNKK